MYKILIALLAIVWVVRYAFGLSFLVLLAHYTSWNIAILEIVATGLLGLVILHYLKARIGRRLVNRLMKTGELPGDVLMDALLIMAAGILLIIPSILTDTAGLLLLIPPVRWLIMSFLKQRNLPHVRVLPAGLAGSPASQPSIPAGVIAAGHQNEPRQ